jgi:serine/threonine protein kinase
VASEYEPLDDLAEAVLLGQPVDWASAESSAGEPQREAVRQLKVLAAIAELHRNLVYDVPAAAPPRLERWGRLELLECIGQGSFGEVYRAWDSKLDREVAVKLLQADGAQPEGATVLREARLLARVRHPNVVTVYDADEIEGRVGLWMEFIHGRNLEQILGERRRFDDHEVTRIGIEVCRALSAVHDAGLLHRDIKAQNVMQTGDGRLVLMDFGTGRELEQTPSLDVDTAGTPLYLAPELFDKGAATVRSDVYSTGVLLFHLRTGAYPVRGATVSEVHEAHARGDRLDLVAKAPGVNKTLAGAIGRAIDPEPANRFASSREMLAALGNVQRKAEAQKKKRYWLALAAVSVVAIALAAVPGIRRRNQDRSQPGRSAYFGVTPEKRVVKTPLALFPGTPSPDGRYLPFSEFSTGNLALYEFATGVSRILRKGGNGDDTLVVESIVSGDSSQIAYNWNDASCDCVQLRVIDSTGANDRLLATSPGVAEIVPLEWSRDGTEILGTRKRSGGGTEVVLISTSDGSIRLIRTFSEGGNVTLSPDARYIAYERAAESRDSEVGIYVSAIHGGEEIPVATGSTSDSRPMWTPDGSGLVFMSMRTGGLGLWLQPMKDGRPDGQPQLLEKDMGPFDPITLTQRGSLFYRQRTGLMDVYTVPIDRATGDVRGQPAVAATRHLGSNLAADWSPDGRTLVFASWRTTGRNVLVFHSMESGVDRDLELDLGVVNAPHWSPDGHWIFVGGHDKKGLGALRLIDPQSGRIVSTLFAQSGGMPPLSSFGWDPDGKHLFLRRNSRPEITRFDMSTGEEDLVYAQPPDSYLGRLSVSPDGRWLVSTLYSRREKAFRLIAIPTGGGRPRDLAVVPEPDGIELGDWTPDGRQVLFVRVTRDSEQRKHGEVWIVPSEGGSPRSLGLSRPALRELRVSPTGDYISFTAGFPDKEIWVFENFLPQAPAP